MARVTGTAPVAVVRKNAVWWDMGERIVFTFFEAFLGVVILALGTSFDISTLRAAAVAGIAAVLTLIKTLISTQLGNRDSAAALPSHLDP